MELYVLGVNNDLQDIFVISKQYPIDQLKGAVIGRLRIDPIVLKVARSNHMNMVDLSAIPSFHQGMGDARNKQSKLEQDDYFYNLRFITMKEDGRFRTNYRVKRFSISK